MRVSDYLASKELSWTEATIKSETSRLNRIAPYVEAGDIEGLWREVELLGKYSRVTYWTRAAEYYDFLLVEGIKSGDNIFKQWRKRNARPFKHAYEKKQPTHSYGEAEQVIHTIQDQAVRKESFILLKTGMRISERHKVTSDGYVVGKGDKRRKVFGLEDMPNLQVKDHLLRSELKKIGLKPHDLRKIRATDLARRGMKEADLCKVMGWASFNTASSYIAPMNDEKIEGMM